MFIRKSLFSALHMPSNQQQVSVYIQGFKGHRSFAFQGPLVVMIYKGLLNMTNMNINNDSSSIGLLTVKFPNRYQLYSQQPVNGGLNLQ